MEKIEQSKVVHAQLIEIKLKSSNSLDDGAAFKFRGHNGNGRKEVFTYYTKPLQSSDSGLSLKSVCYFLDLPFSSNNGYNYRRLFGRYCNLHVAQRMIRGKQRPVITNFSFSDKQFFWGYNE